MKVPETASGRRWKHMTQRELIGTYCDWTDVVAEMGATKREAQLAIARVINEILRSSRAKTVTELSARLKVRPSRLIRRRLRLDRATSQRPIGAIRILTNPISVIRLQGVRQDKRKGGGVVVPGHGSYRGAFIATPKKTSTAQVFRRLTSKRTPLECVKVEMEREAELVLYRIVDDAEQASVERLRRELAWRISQRDRAGAGLRAPGSDGLRLAA